MSYCRTYHLYEGRDRCGSWINWKKRPWGLGYRCRHFRHDYQFKNQPLILKLHHKPINADEGSMQTDIASHYGLNDGALTALLAVVEQGVKVSITWPAEDQNFTSSPHGPAFRLRGTLWLVWYVWDNVLLVKGWSLYSSSCGNDRDNVHCGVVGDSRFLSADSHVSPKKASSSGWEVHRQILHSDMTDRRALKIGGSSLLIGHSRLPRTDFTAILPRFLR